MYKKFNRREGAQGQPVRMEVHQDWDVAGKDHLLEAIILLGPGLHEGCAAPARHLPPEHNQPNMAGSLLEPSSTHIE